MSDRSAARRWGRVLGPWVTPTVVALDVALVWSGVLSVRTAVAVGLLIELLLWATVASRVVVAGFTGSLHPARAAALYLSHLFGFVGRHEARLHVVMPRFWKVLPDVPVNHLRKASESGSMPGCPVSVCPVSVCPVPVCPVPVCSA